jgi:Zn-dependent metalloprotease
MSHGVTSRTANLIYSGESGSLNEATSDIFGTMVEYYANNANDPGDYVVGEELFKNNANMSQAIRYMFKPTLDNYSQHCYDPATTPTFEVHGGSGIANSFFYLLAEGAVVPAGFGAGTWANLTPVVAGLQRQHQPGRHRSHRRREDLVPRTDRVHDLGHQLRPGPARRR